MTRKDDLRRLVELRAMRTRRAEEQVQRQRSRHDQTLRALQAAKAESIGHEEKRRREEEALYSNLTQGTIDHRELEQYRGALTTMDHQARALQEQVRGAESHEREEASKKEKLAAEYMREQKLHDRILILAEEKQRKELRRADLVNEVEDGEALRPQGRKR